MPRLTVHTQAKGSVLAYKLHTRTARVSGKPAGCLQKPPVSLPSAQSRPSIPSRCACHASEAIEATKEQQPWSTHTWQWNGHKIVYAVAGCGKPILLVHGFGVSIGLWRKNIPTLAKTNKVYAIDLLGFGSSEKPVMDYTIELWRDLVIAFQKEFIQEPTVLVGNSIGSLVSLAAAAENSDGTSGVVLINCAGGMNNKARLEDWRIKLAYPFFLLLDVILKSEILAARLFNSFRTTENVRKVLETIYVNTDAVDDELVELVCKPGSDPNALAVFVSVLTGPPGPKPEDLMEVIGQPVLVLWGDQDGLTPLDGPIGKWFKELPDRRANMQFHVIENTGHLPNDDDPQAVHDRLLPWLQSL